MLAVVISTDSAREIQDGIDRVRAMVPPQVIVDIWIDHTGGQPRLVIVHAPQ